MKNTRSLAFALASLVALVACDGVAISPLYETQLDLCAEENASLYAERVADCRARFLADGACAGVIGLRGDLLGEPVVVAAELVESSVIDAELPDTAIVRDRVVLLGAAPYFRFVLQLDLLGGAVDLGDTSRMLTIGGGTSHPSGWSTDALARAYLRLTSPPDSDDLPLNEGAIEITRQTPTESAGRFAFTRSDLDIEGCFHAFTSDRMIIMEDP